MDVNRIALNFIGTMVILLALMPGDVSASKLQDQLYDRYDVVATGFLEARQGQRLVENPNQKDASISEIRLQMGVEKDFDLVTVNFKGDLLADGVKEEVIGAVRELNLSFSPLSWADLKVGRQALTWGTGDLLFVNDLFPKDWKSFFIGRDDEYLKAPADAIKLGMFSKLVNVDIVYMPLFNGSNYIDGSRLSYWNPMTGRIEGNNAVLDDDAPNRFFKQDEVAMRLFRRIDSLELAAYGYYGYWKTPEGFDMTHNTLTYPGLAVYGASLRGPLLGGVANIEAGYYDSLDDRKGDDPLIRNSESRFLVGFEREIIPNLTGGIQYYVEWMSNYNDYEKAFAGRPALRDEFRHVITLRLTQLLLNQTLRLSLFTYYSPSDRDAYFRPKIHYKLTDNWALETGANIFSGKNDYSFFGQFEKNTNAYIGARLNF